MADSESIKEIDIHMAVQEATTIMMAFKDTETGPKATTIPNQQKKSKAKGWRADSGEG